MQKWWLCSHEKLIHSALCRYITYLNVVVDGAEGLGER